MYSFSQDHRLKKADEFSSVFLFRKVLHGKYLKIHYLPTTMGHSRLGLVVSKKISKRAVRRNYMKRILRELFRLNCSTWGSYDLIIRVHRYYTHEMFAEVEAEFKHLTCKLVAN